MSILDDPTPEPEQPKEEQAVTPLVANATEGPTEASPAETADNSVPTSAVESTDSATPATSSESDTLTQEVISAAVAEADASSTATPALEVKSQYDLITDALMAAIGDIGANSNFKCMFYGPPGSTKSSMLGEVPNNLIWDFEDGLIAAKTAHYHTGRPMAPNVKSYPYKTMAGGQMLVERLQDGLFPEFEVFSVDSVSDMHKKVIQAFLEAEHAVRPSKNLYKPETDDYVEVNEMISRFIRSLRDLPRDIIITAHAQTVEPKNKPAKTYPDFSEKLSNKLIAMMDIVGYIEMREFILEDQSKVQMPVMRVISDGTIYCKTRVPFLDANGKPMAEIGNPRWVDMKAAWKKAVEEDTLIQEDPVED